MPSVSTKQQHLMGLALHHPEKVKPENRGVLQMNKDELREFATTRAGKFSSYKRRNQK